MKDARPRFLVGAPCCTITVTLFGGEVVMQTRIGNLGFALALAVALMLVAAACSNDGSNWGDARYTAEMRNVEGDPIGTVVMQQGSGGFLVTVMVEGLEPGPHGIHIHSVGTCTPDFKASGGHINVDNRQHGLLNPDGPDNGDLPNIYATVDGAVQSELFTTLVDPDLLMDDDGSAIVIHENRDDHTSQPIGGAGGRVACGVLN